MVYWIGFTKRNRKVKYFKRKFTGYEKSNKKFTQKPSHVLVDGNKIPVIKNYSLKYVIKGDEKIPEISAASIIAKVARDRLITKMSKKFNKYNWDKNSQLWN